jgi:hypothetical protein
MTDTDTIAARLAAAGLRVKPRKWKRIRGCSLSGEYNVWRRMDRSEWVADYGEIELREGTRSECIAACERHHSEAVLAMLETVPSEDVK